MRLIKAHIFLWCCTVYFRWPTLFPTIEKNPFNPCIISARIDNQPSKNKIFFLTTYINHIVKINFKVFHIAYPSALCIHLQFNGLDFMIVSDICNRSTSKLTIFFGVVPLICVVNFSRCYQFAPTILLIDTFRMC